ncbi:MAG: crossover junction endodeoxyribonuclease RuvC [Firmicutes bacterium]|nr:crossover junction endodeoxyribonuclease RuvC [Bacillota bacterium]
MLVLGVDPGTAAVGYGLVRERSGRLETPGYGVVRTPKDLPAAERLLVIHREISSILARHDPDAVAVEELYFNRNVSTALQVGQARGVVLLAAATAGKPVFEYAPPAVKQAVTGYGGADKGQVQAMVRMLLGLGEPPRPDDAADALSVAICCLSSLGLEHVFRGAADRPDGLGAGLRGRAADRGPSGGRSG